MGSGQSPGVPSTGHPGAFFLLSQMPTGVAIFPLQTELKQQRLCLSFVKGAESLSKCQEILHEQRVSPDLFKRHEPL